MPRHQRDGVRVPTDEAGAREPTDAPEPFRERFRAEFLTSEQFSHVIIAIALSFAYAIEAISTQWPLIAVLSAPVLGAVLVPLAYSLPIRSQALALWVRIGSQVLVGAAIVHVTGFGPALSAAYVASAADSLRRWGTRGTIPVLVQSVVATAIGGWAMNAGQLPSQLPPGSVGTLTVLGMVVCVIGIGLLGQFTQRWETSEAHLRQSEVRFRRILDDQTDLVCRYTPDGIVEYINGAYAEFYGADPQLSVGSNIDDITRSRAGAGRHRPGALTTDRVQEEEFLEVRHDGVARWIHWTDRTIYDLDGAPRALQSVGRDIHERRVALAFNQRQAEILEGVAGGDDLGTTLDAIASCLESAFDNLVCTVHVGTAGEISHMASPSLDRELTTIPGLAHVAGVRSRLAEAGFFTQWSVPIVVTATATATSTAGDPIRPGADGFNSAMDAGDVRRATNTGGCDPIAGYLTIARVTQADDRPHLSTSPALDPAADRLVHALAKLAAVAVGHHRALDRLTHQSLHDPLTGLPNRTLLRDRIAVTLANTQRNGRAVGVLLCDLDGFKTVNDGLGHHAGDEVLRITGHRLSRAVRPADTVARLGGDEFVVVCELTSSTPAAEAGAVAERILAAVAQPFAVGATETFLGTSIGIVIAEAGSGVSPDLLLRDADAAMYRAKDQGRGRWSLCDDDLRHQAMARHTTTNALHRALTRSELELHYQPLLNAADESFVGAEALVRWRHPERGLVPPVEFIPFAEQSNLILDIGAWVIDESVRFAASVAPQLPVSINLSGRQLGDPRLVARVSDALSSAGLAAQCLTLEITESVLMQDADAAIEVLRELKRIGVSVAIDDFGTGYSSLAYLKRLPVDALKIDRAFVAGLGVDVGDTTIVAAVIALGHQFGLRVVAEGVETARQFAALCVQECDVVQGYLFSPPMPEAEFLDWLDARKSVSAVQPSRR